VGVLKKTHFFAQNELHLLKMVITDNPTIFLNELCLEMRQLTTAKVYPLPYVRPYTISSALRERR